MRYCVQVFMLHDVGIRNIVCLGAMTLTPTGAALGPEVTERLPPLSDSLHVVTAMHAPAT